jgi:hypothetical protein
MREGPGASVPAGLDPARTARREFTVEVDAQKLERMRKAGHVRGFTLLCDEGENVGGDNSAPNPLGYFLLGVAF